MQSPSERTPTLLLERPGGRAWAAPDEMTTARSWPDDSQWPTTESPIGPVAERDPVLSSPGMALLGAVSILEGYRWIGAIPSSDSRLSTLVSSRGGAVAFALLATVAVLVLTRAGEGGRRTRPQLLVRLATAAVIASSVAVLLAGTGTLAKDAVGVSDLLLASALAGVLIAVERTRRVRRHGAITSARGGSTDGALPVA
jgi:hypothetical protein